MTGHKPVVFHSGLTFKYQTTEAFAAQHGLIAIAIVIDTDEGDAGAFSYPTVDASPGRFQNSSGVSERRFVLKSTILAQTSGLFSGTRLKARDVLIMSQLQLRGNCIARLQAFIIVSVTRINNFLRQGMVAKK